RVPLLRSLTTSPSRVTPRTAASPRNDGGSWIAAARSFSGGVVAHAPSAASTSPAPIHRGERRPSSHRVRSGPLAQRTFPTPPPPAGPSRGAAPAPRGSGG